MKKLLFLISLLVITPIFLKVAPTSVFADPHCITFKVKVKATNYPGGVLQIGCLGDRGPQCTGQIKDIRVGANTAVVLGKCSCFPNENGCIKIGKKLEKKAINSAGKREIVIKTPIPVKCKVTSDKICGTNGDVIKGTIRLKCNKPSVTIPPDTGTPTPPQSVTPGVSQCPIPETVPNVRVSCPTCFVGEPTPTPTPTIAPPTPTPTPTPTPEGNNQ